MHRLDQTNIIDHFRQVRQLLRQFRPALAVLGELETRAEDSSVGPNESVALAADDRGRQRLAFELGQSGLAIEQVELAGHPAMNRWITRLALGVKCGSRGARRSAAERGGAAEVRAVKASVRRVAREILPRPTPQSRKKCRRVIWRAYVWISLTVYPFTIISSRLNRAGQSIRRSWQHTKAQVRKSRGVLKKIRRAPKGQFGRLFRYRLLTMAGSPMAGL